MYDPYRYAPKDSRGRVSPLAHNREGGPLYPWTRDAYERRMRLLHEEPDGSGSLYPWTRDVRRELDRKG